MTGRLLSRLNGEAFATLSAARYGPERCIGFLVMPPTSRVGGSLPAAARLIGRSMWQTCWEKSRSRAPLRRKSNKAREAYDTAQQLYPCVIEIVISSSFNEARMAHLIGCRAWTRSPRGTGGTVRICTKAAAASGRPLGEHPRLCGSTTTSAARRDSAR
jgi:hypothetical protein